MEKILYCEWQQDEDGNWNTECGNTFILLSGCPMDNSMNFCCYCGNVLKQFEDLINAVTP